MINNPELPLVTIVTPSLNQGRFIENTIQSVLTQDYTNIEYMIIDGGSTDSTLDIIEKYADRLTWISEPDSGQSHAINKGFKKARGEIVAWLNSDDTYEPGAVTKAVECLKANPELMLVYGSACFINENSEVVGRFIHSRNHDLWVLVNELDYIMQPTAFFRKKVLDYVGYVDEELNWALDWEFWIRICSRFPARFIDSNMANLRIYSQTKTANGGLLRYIEIVKLLNKYSSSRYPLAFIRYGLNVITDFLSTRAPISYHYISNIVNPLRTRLRRRIANGHGVYPDKWLGKKARFLFPFQMDSNSIRFILNLPDEQHLFPNSLEAKVGGRNVATLMMLAPGRHELTVPYDCSAKKPTEVELVFSKALPKDNQNRRLACKLEEVFFVPGDADRLRTVT